MRVLVTGAAGFAGRHVVRDLREAGHVTIGLDRTDGSGSDVEITGSIHDHELLRAVLHRHTPDACLHLAGMAFVPDGDANPAGVFEANLTGTLAVLEAFRAHTPAARVLVVTSSFVYGRTPRGPIEEDAPLRPCDMYGASKAAADLAALAYAQQFGLHAMTLRPCNQIGPGQSPRFAIPAFARQIGDLRAGRQTVLRVGNLDSTRRFLDIRDAVSAYRLLLERGLPGHAYNLGPAESVRVGNILEMMCRLAGVPLAVERDPALHRPTDHSPDLDVRKLRAHTGWQPHHTMEQTLRDILSEHGGLP